MNERKREQLFAAARGAPAPAPSAAFESKVLRAIRKEGPAAAPSIFDALNRLFPRLAWAALAVIGLSIAADWGLTAAGLPGLGDGMTQISAQWLLTPTGF